MDKAKENACQEALNDAAENSIKDAITRGRHRRIGRSNVQKGKVLIENPAKGRGSKRVLPMDQKQFVPYLKRQKTSLIPGDEQGEEDDSNDEWEAKVELDPKVMEAAVASLNDSAHRGASKHREGNKAEEVSEQNTQQQDDEEEKKLSEADLKSRQRLEAAVKRKKLLLRHSVHIALSIANYMRLDAAANDGEVQCFALSVTPSDTLLSNDDFSDQISRFALWLRAFFRTSAFVGETDPRSKSMSIERPASASERAIQTIQRKGGDILDVLIVVAATVRAQGFRCRIISPLQPVSHKPPTSIRKENKETGCTQVVELQPDAQSDCIFFGWVEIWAPRDKKWVSLDVFSGQVCKEHPKDAITASIERIPAFDPEDQKGDARAEQESQLDLSQRDSKRRKSKRVSKRQRPGTSPSPPLRRVNSDMFYHVIAVEHGRVTDVTRRYVRTWKPIEKARAKGKLFEKAIKKLSKEPVDAASDEAIKLEQEEFDKIAAEDEIPTSVTAIHHHPRYILERHLKKYEIIFPKEPIVGYIKDEPIFLRANVHLLHTKDRWIRQMRVVIGGSSPLKSVRSMNATDATVDLFGFWQTDQLIIHPCVNGKVPRGIHGNVDLWTPDHLPKGTAHINLPYAKIAARKLQVDFAPAMTGFDIRGGRSVPRIEGIVVAIENADLVRDAAVATARAAAERMERRAKEEALRRWLQLLRAVKARQRVKKRYGGAIAAIGTYEEEQQQEGVRKTLEEKSRTESSSRVSPKHAKSSYLQNSRHNGSNAHTHDFDEPKHRRGDTMVRVCKVCGLEMAFEVL